MHIHAYVLYNSLFTLAWVLFLKLLWNMVIMSYTCYFHKWWGWKQTWMGFKEIHEIILHCKHDWKKVGTVVEVRLLEWQTEKLFLNHLVLVSCVVMLGYHKEHQWNFHSICYWMIFTLQYFVNHLTVIMVDRSGFTLMQNFESFMPFFHKLFGPRSPIHNCGTWSTLI